MRAIWMFFKIKKANVQKKKNYYVNEQYVN